jgi:protein involved in temperature-dependent protein secretion
MAFDDAQRCRELIDANRLPEALQIARRIAKAQPTNVQARALLLEVLHAKGEHASIATEIADLERAHPGNAQVQQLKKRFVRKG